MVAPPRWRPANGDAPSRLGAIEDHLGRSEEYLRHRDEGIDELDRRVRKIEEWKQDMLVFVGSTKIRWSVVNFVTGIVAAVAVVALSKWFHL